MALAAADSPEINRGFLFENKCFFIGRGFGDLYLVCFVSTGMNLALMFWDMNWKVCRRFRFVAGALRILKLRPALKRA